MSLELAQQIADTYGLRHVDVIHVARLIEKAYAEWCPKNRVQKAFDKGRATGIHREQARARRAKKKETMTTAQAFDEWMRRYTEDPAAFSAEFEAVDSHRRKKPKAKASEYGIACAAFLSKLMREKPGRRKRK